MKLLKNLFICNLIVLLAFLLMPAFLITDDIGFLQTLIDSVGKPK